MAHNPRIRGHYRHLTRSIYSPILYTVTYTDDLDALISALTLRTKEDPLMLLIPSEN